MSSLLQFHTGAITDATDAPDEFWNGIPHEADGSIAVDTVTAIDHHHAGLPYTALGRLATGVAPVTSFGSGAAPFNAAGKLVLIGNDVAVAFLAALGYTASSEAIGGVAS